MGIPGGRRHTDGPIDPFDAFCCETAASMGSSGAHLWPAKYWPVLAWHLSGRPGRRHTDAV